MTIRARGRLALILAAGLLVCFAESSQAAADAAASASPKPETAAAPGKNAKHSAHHWKKYAHRRSGKVALKPPADNKADRAADTSSVPAAIPPSVANANAQMASPDSPTGKAMAMSAWANEVLQVTPVAAEPATDAPVVVSDRLNDVDRALRDSAPPAPMTMASAEARAAAAPPVAASSDEHSTWDETSLIGKIFIGFGALLTIASAARMFMA